MPGSMLMSPPRPPIPCIWVSCSRRSPRSNAPLRIFSAVRIAFSASILAAAFSTSAMISPMPRIRPAIRAGSNSSSASSFSPVPMSLMGLPVTALIERARQIDRVLAGEGVGNEEHFVRIDSVLDLGRLAHHCVIERGPAGRVEHHHVIGAELCCLDGPPSDLRGGMYLNNRQRVDLQLADKQG